eukprot:jgi/Botrbrau1/12112/Bobra.0186s0031.2
MDKVYAAGASGLKPVDGRYQIASRSSKRFQRANGERSASTTKVAVRARASAPARSPTRRNPNLEAIKVEEPRHADELGTLEFARSATTPLAEHEHLEEKRTSLGPTLGSGKSGFGSPTSQASVEERTSQAHVEERGLSRTLADEAYLQNLRPWTSYGRALGMRGAVLMPRGGDIESDSEGEDLLEEGEGSDVTELIFRLDRKGSGWGEEILPSLTVEHRPLTKKRERNRSSMPRPWTAGSAELYLRDRCGIPQDKVDAVMTKAVAWRITPGGRPLIDRRRRSRVERNLPLVAEYLQDCGLPEGLEGVGRVFLEIPEVMLCKPSTTDRWDRRAVELAAYRWRFGHVNVPEEYKENPELGYWVRKQRAARQQGALTEERLWILKAIGFEFGEEANITPSWELHFDLLMDWLLLKELQGQRESVEWTGLTWGPEGGPRAREAALWVQLQREFQRRNLLLRPAIRRLEALGFQWTPQGGTEEEMRWLAQVGRLLYVVERGKTASAADWQERLQAERRAKVQGRSPPGEPPQAPSFPSTLMAGRRERFLQPPASSPDTLIQKEVRKRMEGWKWAKSEPGLKYWICKQHWLWRRGLLSPERTALLRQAGMSFGYQPSQQWRDSAHLIAFWLTGSFIAKEVMQEAQEEAPSSASGGSAGLSASNLFISEFEGEDMEEVGPSPQSQTAEASVGQGSPRQQRRASRGHELEPQRRHGEVEDIFLRSDAALPWALPDRPAGSGRSGGDARLGNYLAGQLGQRHASPHAEGDSLWVLPEAAPANAGAVGRGDREDFDQLEALMYRPRELDDGPASADWVVSRQRQCSVTYRTGSPLGRPRGLRWPRLVPLRWVQEQRMLFAEGRLPRARQRYMAILGILWLLSDKVTKMEDEEWEAFFRQLPGADTSMRERWEEPPPGPLRDWLQQQRGLYALGLLPDNRFELLREVGVCWEAVRSWQDQEWDDLIALLLQATQIGGEGGIEEGGREPVRLPAHLLYRLHAACTAWRAGHLPASQVAQLQAFGLSPDLALPPSLIAS